MAFYKKANMADMQVNSAAKGINKSRMEDFSYKYERK